MGEDFGQMFEESMRSVKPGEIVRGRVVKIGAEVVTIDIGYKSEGHIPVSEFRQRDGTLTVSEGDEIDVLVTGKMGADVLAVPWQEIEHTGWDAGFCKDFHEHGADD